MTELNTEYWSLLLPEEWTAEEEEDTMIITDEDEASVIEISTLVPEEGVSVQELLDDLSDGAEVTQLARMPARYQQMEEEGGFWREWYCDAGMALLIVTHGCDAANRHLDDAIVDEILATLSPRAIP